VGDVELDRPATTRFKVCEQQSFLGSEQVTRVWLAMEHLLGGAPFNHHLPEALQCVAQKLTVCVRKFGCAIMACDQPLRLRDSISEVWRRNVNLPHASMEARQRMCILGRRNLAWRYGRVIRPERNCEAIMDVDVRRDSRVERGDWTLGLYEPPSKLNFKLCAALMRYMRNSGNNVARQQAHHQPVRVLKNDCLISCQAEHCGNRYACR
jgi:hypothetical protein